MFKALGLVSSDLECCRTGPFLLDLLESLAHRPPAPVAELGLEIE